MLHLLLCFLGIGLVAGAPGGGGMFNPFAIMQQQMLQQQMLQQQMAIAQQQAQAAQQAQQAAAAGGAAGDDANGVRGGGRGFRGYGGRGFGGGFFPFPVFNPFFPGFGGGFGGFPGAGFPGAGFPGAGFPGGFAGQPFFRNLNNSVRKVWNNLTGAQTPNGAPNPGMKLSDQQMEQLSQMIASKLGPNATEDQIDLMLKKMMAEMGNPNLGQNGINPNIGQNYPHDQYDDNYDGMNDQGVYDE